MRVCVVMATYNGEAYVREQMQSLRMQTVAVDEVLICDDCSQDGTLARVQEFIDEHNLSHWKAQVNKENLGYRRNFAKLLEQSSGDIIFLCDQDDVWHPNKIEKIVEIFKQHPDALSVNASFDVIDKEGEPLLVPEKSGWINHGLLPVVVPRGNVQKIASCRAKPPALLVRSNISPGCTMAVRAAVRDEYLAHTTYTLPHDWELNIIADARDGMYFYNEPLIGYRIHETNAIGLSSQSKFAQLPFGQRRRAWHAIVEDAVTVSMRYIDDAQVKTRLQTYVHLRSEVLETGSLKALVGLYTKCGALYRKIIRFKGRLGDWYTVLMRKKARHKQEDSTNG